MDNNSLNLGIRAHVMRLYNGHRSFYGSLDLFGRVGWTWGTRRDS